MDSLKNNNEQQTHYYIGNVLVKERNLSFQILNWAYYAPIGRLVRFFMRLGWFNRLSGIYQNSRWSKWHIAKFIKKYNISIDDYIVPTGGYRSFNDFFIRTLKPGVRPINADPETIIAPADSKIYVITNISTDTSFCVKKQPFNLEKFLSSQSIAKDFSNGTMMIFRLAAYDYHRVHFPIDCIPSTPTTISGIFESVHPIAFAAGIQPLTENERHLILLKSEKFGIVALVLIGAMMVGKIVETYQPSQSYKKGDEVGYFAFGGSTVVLLFKPNVVTIPDAFIQHSLQGFQSAVKMGESVGILQFLT